MIAAQIPALESEVNGGPRFTLPIVTRPTTGSTTLPRLFSAIENDSGTGYQIASPPTPATNGILGPSENSIVSNSSVSNSNAWASAANAVGGNVTGVLQQLAQSAASGGQNAPLGPQVDFAPVDGTAGTTTTTSSGGGSAIVFIIGAIVVAILLYLHFKKKAAAGEAK